MKLKSAIQILERQLSQIKIIEKGNSTWVLQTREYIEKFFGEKSNLLLFFKDFTFNRLHSYGSEDDPLLVDRKKKATEHLISCIQTLKDIGIYKKPRENFLSSLSDTALWTMFGTILPLIIYLSFYFGKKEGDNKIDRLEIEIQKNIDTISSLRVSTFPNTNPISKTDTSETQNK